MPVRLTPRFIAALEVTGKRKHVPDGIVPGLLLRATPSGVKTFAVWHRVNGRPRLYTIGRFPIISLADARERARDILSRANRGEDPQSLKLDARRAETFDQLADRFVGFREANLAAATATEYRRMIKAYLADSPLGRMASRDVRRLQVRELLERIARDAPVMSNRVFQFVRATCRWAVREELLEVNPCEGLQRPRREHTRDRALRDEEVKVLWAALEGEPERVAAAVKLLVLLGQRSTETLEMRWTDLDLKGRVWTIPGSRRKGGRTHILPLSNAAVRVLRDLRAASGQEERVLVGVSISNPHRWWDPIRETALKAGAEPFTKHDLRRTCATGCARLGASPYIVSRILGHAS